MKKLNTGFTFLELIITLVIIALIAVIAIPRFINQSSNARTAALNGLIGAINSDVKLSTDQFRNDTNATNNKISSLLIDGHTITVMPNTGYPTANETGIKAILPPLNGYLISYQGDIAVFNFAKPITHCNVTYNDTTGLAIADNSGC